MSAFADLVRGRRMTRAFDGRGVEPAVIDELVELASWSPSAGKTQGWHLVVLEGAETERFWSVTLPSERRRNFRWRALVDAPVIMLPLSDPEAYVRRYGEPDKQATGLGMGRSSWPAPYWTIDTSMAVMTLLLAAHERGLGALLFGVFQGEAELRRVLGIPEDLELIGAIALGHRLDGAEQRGRSAGRSRARVDDIIHRGRW